MKKYLIIIQNEFQRHLAYRANIASYSLGHLFEITAQVVIWTVIFQSADQVRGYTYSEMMSYVVIGWFILFATSNYGFEEKIAKDIHQGTLSNLIVKPISYLKYTAAVSLGRIIFAFFIVVLIELTMFSLLRDRLLINLDPAVIGLLLLMMVLAYLIKLFFSILTGLLAFWIIEISGAYFSLNVLTKFLSGALFPINLLPAGFVAASLWFPFAYTFFVPIQLYLGKISLMDGLYGLAMQLVWLVLLYAIIKLVWRAGLKRYESAGI